jgi:uncharacterized membrane protein
VTGYALIAVVFPRKGSINGYERFVMSVAASICITPLIGFLLNYTEWGIRLEPVMICLITFTFLCVVIASLRRHRLHPEDRFSPDILQFCKGTVAFFFPSSDGSKLNRALSVLFILALLSTTLTVVLALNVPNNQENFTELYTLSPNHTLTNQSKLFFVGQTQPVIVGIEAFADVVQVQIEGGAQQLFQLRVAGPSPGMDELVEEDALHVVMPRVEGIHPASAEHARFD